MAQITLVSKYKDKMGRYKYRVRFRIPAQKNPKQLTLRAMSKLDVEREVESFAASIHAVRSPS